MIRLLPILAAIVFALPAMAQDNPIVQRMAAFASAYNAGDADAVAGFYVSDGIVLPPRREAALGRGAIREIYAGAFAGGAGNLRFRMQEIRQHGPAAAVAIGETLFAVNGQDIRARFLHVWTLENGIWMLSRDIYNVIGPAG